MSYKDLINRLKNEKIINDKVADAMLRTPRKDFLPRMFNHLESFDTALPIGHGQTISQPTVVGHMITLLDVNRNHRILEIGTGSGWVAAILSRLGREVITVERVPELYADAKERLKKYTNVKVMFGDGSCGWPKYAPYDRILISAAVPKIHERVINQLTDDGWIVAPVGELYSQVITKVNKQNEIITTIPVVFVPIIGECGFRREEV